MGVYCIADQSNGPASRREPARGRLGIPGTGGDEVEGEIETEEVDMTVVSGREIDEAVLPFSVSLDVDLLGFQVNSVVSGVLDHLIADVVDGARLDQADTRARER